LEPNYIKAYKEGILKDKAEILYRQLKNCNLCPRNCHADRLSGDLGTCKTGELSEVSSYMPHFGEEKPISGTYGSGTIFFTHCNLLCNFCQNFDISHKGKGQPVTPRELANMMLSLQDMGCHNINFVTPTHVLPQILQALVIAINDGLHIPLVYNSGGYDHVSTLKHLDGIIDIYMPDFKFWDREISSKTCQAPDYPEVVKAAVSEMQRQVGDLKINSFGIAERGLLIRHLVLPEGLAGTENVMEFISSQISPGTYVNIMDQYRPWGLALENGKLQRPISKYEFIKALNSAKKSGVSRLNDRD